MMKRLYQWVLHWAETPYAVPALFLLAFAESSFFPIPPDALLIVLCLGMVKKSFRYAAVCAVASVLGGVLGYYIGYLGFSVVGKPIIEFYGLWGKVGIVASKYSESAVMALAAAGFTPIPYKVFTIVTGFFDAIASGAATFPMEALQKTVESPEALEAVKADIAGLKPMGLWTFIIVSGISRSARFFLVAGMIFFFGETIRDFIEKYFNLLTIAFMVLLVLGFIVIKYLV